MKKIVAKRKDIVFFLKMYPLVSLHPKAYAKSLAIICEKDNDKAIKMLEDVYAKKALPAATCKTDALDKSIALAQSLGISGTPTIIFADGTRASGAMPADKLIEMIDAKKAVKKK